MNLGIVHHRRIAGLLALVLYWGRLQAAEPANPVVAQPKSPSTTQVEPAPRLGTKGVNLKDWEKNFGKPQSFLESSGRESHPEQMLPSPPPRRVDRQTQDRLDLQRNWIFATPEELMRGPLSGNVLKPSGHNADGKESAPTTVMQRYYQRLTHTGDQANRSPGSLKTTDTSGGEQAGKSDWSANPAANPLNALPASLRALIAPELNPGKPVSSGNFLPGTGGISPEQLRARREHEAQITEFKRIIDFEQPVTLTAAKIAPLSKPASFNSSILSVPSTQHPNASPAGGTLYTGSSAAPKAPAAPVAPTLAPALLAPTPTRQMPPPPFTAPTRNF